MIGFSGLNFNDIPAAANVDLAQQAWARENRPDLIVCGQFRFPE
jgi:hypothetical protein